MEAIRRRKRLRTIPQVKVHPDLHVELARLAYEDGRSIQYVVHAILCEKLNRPELLRLSFLESTIA